jgi:hypothetical protein
MKRHGTRGDRFLMQNEFRRGRLATARFAHQSQGLAAANGETDTVDGLHPAFHAPPNQARTDREVFFEIAHLE